MGFGTPVVLTTVLANQAILKERSSYVKDFWSDVQEKITVNASASNPALGDIIVEDLPSGITLTRVILLLKVRAIENTDGAANAVSGAQVIEVKENSEEDWSAALTAIDLIDNMWTIAGTTKEAGDVLLGDNDIKAKVSGNGTYNVRWASATVDAIALEFSDVQVGFRMFWEVE